MTSIDPGCLELIHAEIDGLNTPGQSSLLKEMLDRDPAARELFMEMKDLSATLSAMGDVDPPADLHRGILKTVEEGRRRKNLNMNGWIEARWRSGRTVLRYGYAFGAGLILGVAGLAWYLGGAQGLVGVRPEQIKGTIAGSEGVAGMALVGKIPLDLEPLSGAVSLWRSGTGFVVSMDVDARARGGPVAVMLGGEPGGISVTGLTQSSGQIGSFQSGAGEVSWEMSGHHELAIRFEAPGGEAAKLALRVLAPGEPAHLIPLPLQ